MSDSHFSDFELDSQEILKEQRIANFECPHCAEPLAKVKHGSICDMCGWQDIDLHQGRKSTAPEAS